MPSPVPAPLILVMCTGNVCRSPMAEAVFSHKLRVAGVKADVVSRGLAAPVGRPPHKFAVKVAQDRNTPISPDKKAEAVTASDLNSAAAVFVMDNGHRHDIQARFPAYSGKVFLLGHWQQREIVDPINLPLDAFERAWVSIEAGAGAWIERLQRAGMIPAATLA